jgi:hypothetical protein
MLRFVTYKNGECVKSDEIEVSEGEEERGEEGAEEGAEGGCNWEEEEGGEGVGHNFCLGEVVA